MTDILEHTTVTTKTRTATFAEVNTWVELVSAVQANAGVALVPMETLRRLEGAQRLGVHVLKSIGARLGTLGLGHMPNDLPNRQDQDAILYQYGSPASEVISAVRTGLKGANAIRSTYQALHRLNAAPEESKVVHREVLDDKLATATRAIAELLSPADRSDILGSLGHR